MRASKSRDLNRMAKIGNDNLCLILHVHDFGTLKFIIQVSAEENEGRFIHVI